MRRQERSHRIESKTIRQAAPRFTDEQKAQIMAWLDQNFTPTEVARAGFRAWGRDISPTTIQRYRQKGIQ